MMFLWSLLGQLLALLAVVSAKSSTANSILVIHDSSVDPKEYSIFFDGLKKNGFEVTFRTPKEVSPPLTVQGLPAFGQVIVFAPDTKTFASDITPQALVQLLNMKINLLLALGPKQTMLTSLASEFSLILPPPGTPLISHFPERKDPASVLPIPPPAKGTVTSPKQKPIWFSGIPFALGQNPFVFPILSAPAESFAADSESDAGADALVEAADKAGEGLWAGSAMSVVAGFQTGGGARAVWAGGVQMFSDEYAKKSLPSGGESGNKQFALEVAAWAFQETLVLRIDNTTHHRAGETEPRAHYITGDDVVYTAHISRFDPVAALWKPYSGLDDVQLEFTMLDPHVRTALPPVRGKKGVYEVAFRVPDRHGVFKFIIDYKRKGWTSLYSSTTVPVVPPRHDGYPRFLSAAWPYYAGAISTSVGFVLFAALWLAGDDHEGARRKKGAKVE